MDESGEMDAGQVLKRAREEGTPLIDGETVKFVWSGSRPAGLLCDLNGFQPDRAFVLRQVGPDVWTHTLTLPADAYLEYVFWQDDARVADPFNPHLTPNGMGEYSHYFYMPGGRPTPLRLRRRSVAHGTVSRHAIDARPLLAGGRRTVWLYRPPTDAPCPLLVVLDGQDYLSRADLPVQVDNLIAEGRIEPIALAMVASRPRARFLEYACSDATLGFLAQNVVGLARAQLNLIEPGAAVGGYGVMGASMGGLMALYSGLRAPGLFGRVLSQSGAFTMHGQEPVAWELVEHLPVRPVRIWMDAGRYEWLLEPNRRMEELLRAKGYEVVYKEFNAGHNYPAWRDDLARGLEWLFGGR